MSVVAHNDGLKLRTGPANGTNAKWTLAWHIAGMNDKGWATRSAEWQVMGERSVGRPNVVGEKTLFGEGEQYR